MYDKKALLQQAVGGAPFGVSGVQESGASPAPFERTYPPSAFADTWPLKPLAPVKIGLRLVGEDVITGAMSMASSRASMLFPGGTDVDGWIECYSAELMRDVLAMAMCQPDDVTKPWFPDIPNDTIRIALAPLTVKNLWEEFQRLQAQLSPLTEEATDEEIEALGQLFVGGGFLDDLEPHHARKVRRLITYLREVLSGG